MKKSLLIISIILIYATRIIAADSVYVSQTKESRYDRRIHRYRKHWAALIPMQFVIQNAGNMGAISAGIGWNYGKRKQWETDLLFGYIPKHQSSRGKLTTTLKENYIPWSINLANIFPNATDKITQQMSIEPLTASIYLNTVYGHEFWKSQPGRYPDGYYEFMSTKFRLNVGVGERIMFKLPEDKKIIFSRMALFYEISTCDLYIRSLFQGNGVKFTDIFGCSIGMKFYTK